MSKTLSIISANLGRGVSQKEFDENLLLLYNISNKTETVFCLQEIDEADEANELKFALELFGPSHRIVGGLKRTPVIVPRHFVHKKSRVELASRGLAKVTPARFIVSDRFDMDPKGDLPQVVVLNTHMPLNRPNTQKLRRAVRVALRTQATYHLMRGRIVIWAADTNTLGIFPRMMPRERTIVRKRLDMVRMATPKGVTATVQYKSIIPLTIDGHDALAVKIKFEVP